MRGINQEQVLRWLSFFAVVFGYIAVIAAGVWWATTEDYAAIGALVVGVALIHFSITATK